VIRSGTQQERQQFLQEESDQLPNDVYRVHLVNLSGSQSNITASTSESKIGEPLNTREAP